MNIQLQNVTYTYAGKYQRVTAVDGVSYTFHDGTLYTIMGASGSGKSTLLSLLAGLKLPTEGEITLWPHRHGTDGFYICRITRRP